MSGPGGDAGETFLVEARELLAQLEEALLRLEQQPDDGELVNTAFRALHTLKGSGAMFGPPRLAEFAHHVETAFEPVRRRALAPGSGLISTVLAATDHLKVLLETPDAADPDRTEALVAALGGSGAVAAPAGQAAPSPPEPPTARGATWRILVRLAPNALELGINPLALLDELRGLGRCDVVARTERIPPLHLIEPTSCYVDWEILLTTERPRTAIEDVFLFVADDGEIVIDELADDPGAPVPRLGELLVARGDAEPAQVDRALARQRRIGELLVGAEGVPATAVQGALATQAHLKEARQQAEQANVTIRVPAARLDALMDQVGELVIAQARLSQLAYARRDPALSSAAEEIERLATELRDATMGVRMVPIGSLFGRYRRVVRDLSRELGKEVELTTAGEETELDKTVIERLGDPLVHLIRNAVDHGIEDAGARAAAGKPKAGSVHLEARQAGAEVLISIRDDGAGLDRARIRAKAVERGLIESSAEIGEAQIDQLIFHPGLSTAGEVSNVSGRGVGMDVVKTTIEELRGSIEVASSPGRGTAITLRLPLTLAIIDGLLVRVGGGMFVLPLAAVEECVELAAAEHKGSSARSFLNIRGALVPFLRLHAIFNVEADRNGEMVVVVGSEQGRVGLVVDQVIGHHQTVIKSLSRLHRGITGLAGATILGDGQVALILDVMPLIDGAQEITQQRRLSA